MGRVTFNRTLGGGCSSSSNTTGAPGGHPPFNAQLLQLLQNVVHQQQVQNTHPNGPRGLPAPFAPTHGGFPAPSALFAVPPQAPQLCPSAPQFTDLASLFSSMSVQQPACTQDNNYYMDTGASSHMSYDQGNLLSLKPCGKSKVIMVGNGVLLSVSYIGDTFLPLSRTPLALKNVLVSDQMVKNLISVCRFTIDNWVSVEFDPFGFSIKDLNTGQLLHRADSIGDLYPSPQPSVPSTTAFVVVSPSCGIVTWVIRVSLPLVFELVHSDLWTSPISSLSGYKYYILFLDDFSHFLWVFPLRVKSDVFKVFCTFRAYVVNQFKTNIQSFQCDNGREFNNANLLSLFQNHGIRIRFSCPYTSQQNGKAERAIRTINNVMRTLLFQASLPPNFWAEALNMTVHILNLLPTTTLSFQSPCEKLYGTFPTVMHLRVFGCLCYPNLSSTTPHKLSPRSTACVYLGPSANHRGHRYYDLVSHRIIISRHVDHFPYSSFNDLPPVSAYDDLLEDGSSPTLDFVITPAPTTSPKSPQTSPVAPTPSGVAVPTTTTPIASDAPSTSNAPLATTADTGHTTSTPTVSSTHPMTTRSRTRNLKPRQILNLLAVSSLSPIPTSTTQAVCDPHWKEAMDSEMSALLFNHTWDLVLPPPMLTSLALDGCIVTSLTVRVILLATKLPGLDYDETFSPVVKPATIRTVLSISVSLNWPIHHLDVKNAFLNGDLTEEVYMKQPPSYVHPSYPNHVCQLRKALYGLKQSPRAWSQRFAVFITSLGFSSSKFDSSLFVYHHGRDTIYLLLYVDDIILTASSPDLVTRVISRLSFEFQMTDLGALFFWELLPLEIISRASMDTCNPCSTPADTKSKLPLSGAPVSDPTLYRSLAGALQYLTFTRPDISYAVQQICLFMHDPREPHFNALKRILRYHRGTLSMGLFLRPSSIDRLVSYTDVDWATILFLGRLSDNMLSLVPVPKLNIVA
ncbi:LOW QUALITY PROTEIN: hypothetical protein OSB04_023220 [Centaurea solstitialis]|uniref:Integrase catalytic domain-containing protein n=1 Tax=Centaurea solstitialis TaxID=347529 RepID=A0AA38SR92_9ASTR|nr:LOW QUALITY PROTEIN: hypothetical protein OSB04_023220 [Centaurea solstitialis]